MENLLNNKSVLRNLLQQGDIVNTINGGTSETYITAEQNNNNIIIKVFAAGVASTDFKITLNRNKLVIARHLNVSPIAGGEEKFAVPAFLRFFDLPFTVNKDGIEAYYEEGVLRIIVPLHNEQQLNRDIKIKEL